MNRTLLMVSCAVLLAPSSHSIFAKPVPDNLGNGLNKIIENRLLQSGAIQPPANGGAGYKAAVAKLAASYDKLAIVNSVNNRYLVDIMPNGKVPVTSLRNSLQSAFPLMQVQAVDT